MQFGSKFISMAEARASGCPRGPESGFVWEETHPGAAGMAGPGAGEPRGGASRLGCEDAGEEESFVPRCLVRSAPPPRAPSLPDQHCLPAFPPGVDLGWTEAAPCCREVWGWDVPNSWPPSSSVLTESHTQRLHHGPLQQNSATHVSYTFPRRIQNNSFKKSRAVGLKGGYVPPTHSQKVLWIAPPTIWV